jgi:tetratricopeptide (TPR) repeat protein
MAANAPQMSDAEIWQYIRLLRTHPEQYLRIAEDTIQQYPDDIEGYDHCATYYIEMEQYDEALCQLDKALALWDIYITRFKRATVLSRLKRYQEALAEFERCGPEGERGYNTIMYANRATCHAYLGNREAALAECAKIRDDHCMPGTHGEFGGTKAQIIDQVRRVAGAVRTG